MTSYTCPIEGCPYGEDEEKSLPAVRAHINATSDGDHEWSDLKPTVEQQGQEGPQDAEDDAGADAEGDGAAGEDDGPQQAAIGPDVDAEYQAQVQGAVEADPEPVEDSGAVDVEPVEDATDTDGDGDGLGTAASVVAASVALALVVLLVQNGDDEAGDPTDALSGDADGETDADPSDVVGGWE